MDNLKELVKKPLGIGLVVLVMGVIVLGLILLLGGKDNNKLGEQMLVKKGNEEVMVHKNGQLDFQGNTPFSQKWVGRNGETLYDYFQKRIADGEYSNFTDIDCYLLSYEDSDGQHDVCLAESTELAILFETFNDPGGGGPTGESIDDYFNNGDDGDPGSGDGNGDSSDNGDGDTGGGDNGDSGGSGGGTPIPTPEDDCPYWRLSYCVYPNPTPPPTTPTPNPGEVLPPDCIVNTLTGRTVISSELCVSQPTPIP